MIKTNKNDSPELLTDDERLEYSEICNFYRHDNSIAYQLAAIILPISFGSLAVAAQAPKIAYPLAGFSLVLYVFWMAFSERLAWYSDVRGARLRELEAKAGLMHHRYFSNLPPDLSKKIGRKISIRRLRIVYLFILIASWIFLLIYLAG